MRKDYTNANKRFYEKDNIHSKTKSKKNKKLVIRTFFYIYILNNLDEFETLTKKCFKYQKEIEEKEKIRNPLIYIHSLMPLFHTSIDEEGNEYFFEFDNFECFEGLKDDLFLFLSDFKKGFSDEKISLLKEGLCFFLNKGEFSKKLFVDYFIKEYKDNSNLREKSGMFDFDMLLEIAKEDRRILDIVSNDVKDELVEFLEFIEKET